MPCAHKECGDARACQSNELGRHEAPRHCLTESKRDTKGRRAIALDRRYTELRFIVLGTLAPDDAEMSRKTQSSGESLTTFENRRHETCKCMLHGWFERLGKVPVKRLPPNSPLSIDRRRRRKTMPETAVTKKQEDRDYLSRWLGSELPLFRGNLFGIHPFELMRQLSDDMNRLLSAVFGHPLSK